MQLSEPECSGVKPGQPKAPDIWLENSHVIIVSVISRSGTCHTVILYFLTSFIISILPLNKVENSVSYTMSLLISKNVLILYNLSNSYQVLLVFYCDIPHQLYSDHSQSTSLPSCTQIPQGCLNWLLLSAHGYCSNLTRTTIFIVSNPHYLQHKLHLSIQDYAQST